MIFEEDNKGYVNMEEKEIREKLINEMEVDVKIIAKIIEDFVPRAPFEIVETDGLKIGIVNDIPYMDENPKITQKLLFRITKEMGYIPHDIREVGPDNERCILLVKDLGGKLGKSIALGKDTIYMGVSVFDDR